MPLTFSSSQGRTPPRLVVLLCQSVLMFWNLDLLPVWGDELFTLRTIAHPIAGLITTVQNDMHPPLYFILPSAKRAERNVRLCS